MNRILLSQKNLSYCLNGIADIDLFDGGVEVGERDLSSGQPFVVRVSDGDNDLFLEMNIFNFLTRPLFRLFSVFSNKLYNFYNKSMHKMSIQ